METKYVLDSCALLEYVYKETGADVVKSIININNPHRALLIFSLK